MKFNEQFLTYEGERRDPDGSYAGPGNAYGDPEIESVLRDFRASVHAWSDAVYHRPRQVEPVRAWIVWRRATAWALGTVLLAGGAGAGLLQYQHRQELARIAAVRDAERQRQLMEDSARQAEQELAKVDRDISRQVPDAMEPLAQLMTSGTSQ